MPDYATGELNPNEKELKRLDGIKISSKKDLIEVLEILDKLGIQPEGNVRQAVEQYFGKMDVYSVKSVINKLEDDIKIEAEKEIKTSYVPEAKIKELVSDYETYTKNKGYNDKEAVNQIYKNNKGKLSEENIKRFLDKQRGFYEETKKKLNEELLTKKEKDLAAEKVVEIKKYKEKKDLEAQIEKKAQKISIEKVQFEHKVEKELSKYQDEETAQKTAEEITKKAYEEVIDQKDKTKKVEVTVEELIAESPIAILEKEDKEKIKEKLEEVVLETQADKAVEEKSAEVSKNIIKDLKQDERLEELISRNEDVIQEKIEEAVKEEILGREVLTEDEKVSDLEAKVKKVLSEEGIQSEQEIFTNKSEIKKASQEIEHWSEMNKDEVNRFRGENIANQIDVEIWNQNSNLNKEQLKALEEYKALIKEVYFSDSDLDQYRSEAVAKASGDVGPGSINNAWTDLKGFYNMLKRTPEETQSVFDRYQNIKNVFGKEVNLPFNIKECRSFEGISNVFQNTKIGGVWTKAQNYVNNLGSKFFEKVGAKGFLKTFAEKGLSILAKKGLEKGALLVAKVALKVALRAIPYVGWVLLALDVIKKVGGFFGNLAKKFGLSLGIKDYLQENFGKAMGGAMNFLLKGLMAVVLIPAILGGMLSSALMGPIAIGSVGGLLGYQMLQDNLVSSMVPPTDENGDEPGEDFGSDDYSEVIAGNIAIPKCDPNTHDRRILREIAMSIKGKVEYNRAATWFVIGSHPKWGVAKCGGEPCGLDCAKFVSWVWLQCMGKERGRNELGSTIDLVESGNKGANGWQNIHPRSVSDLKIGDIFVRDNTCDGARCNHAVIYIGDGETMESTRDNNNPHIDKVYKFTDNGIFLEKDRNRMNPKKIYDHIIRINNVFTLENQ